MIEDRLKDIVQELVTNKETFLVDLSLLPSHGTTKLAVVLDNDQGMSIDECAEISRKLGAIIEEEELLTTAYNLEVSSPGLDQPLKLSRQYVKNIGRDVRVLLKESSGEIIGKLEEVEEEGITVRALKKTKNKGQKSYEKETQFMPFGEIHKTNILIQF